MNAKLKIFLTFILALGILSINISSVSAVPNTATDDGGSSNNGGCTYGVICQYQFCGDSSITNCDYNYQTAIVQVAYRCSESDKTVKNCNVFTAQTGGCKNNGTSSMQIGFNVNGIFDRAPLDFTDEVYGEDTNASPINFAGYFKKNGYNCPPIKVSGSGNNYSADYAGNGSGMIYGQSVGCIYQGQKDLDLKGKACEQTDSILQDSLEQQFDDVEDAVNSDGILVDTQKIIDWANAEGYEVDSLEDPCSIISPTLQEMLQTAFWIISVGGIILLVVMTAISFIKAITGSDDEKFRDAIKHLFTRIIVVIILLLLPVLLDFIITLINNSIGEGEVSVGADGEIFCDVTGD